MSLQTPLRHSANRAYKMLAGKLEKLDIIEIKDFLFHFPSRYEDYSKISDINKLQPGETMTAQGEVIDFKNNYLRGARIKTIQKAIVADSTGTIELSWFNQPFLSKTLEKGARISLSGRVEKNKSRMTMISPEFEILFDSQENPIHTGRFVPVYPETKGITSKWLRRQIHKLLLQYDDEFEEFLPAEIVRQFNFLNFRTALREIHFPDNPEAAKRARERLSFDELFLIQLASVKRRRDWQENNYGIALDVSKHSNKIESFINSLPFTLTDAQNRAVGEILADMSKAKQMNRLLQGDVGSGKTVVAAIAMYAAFLEGYQTVFMAPTEILAEQHYKSISSLLTNMGVSVDLVTGSKKPKEIKAQNSKTKNNRDITRKENQNSKSNILVGTHALLSDKIKLDKAALAIIDEQQRFGVEQRSMIRKKGKNTHLLTMTATPIPRTVALTMYGELDLSYLNEMPGGRKRVRTWLVPPEKRDGAYQWIRKQVKETHSQVFIICPFIEESESMQTVKAAAKEFERLKTEIFSDLKLGLLHGKLKPKEKDQTMNDFKEGKLDILVSTPVVEVGIDIPNATVIMIEAAERFGLAQLHQLRGRVGRGEKQSYCLLFSSAEGGSSTGRLKAMETVYSGAQLSELDLKLRGHGDLYGTAQHGIPKLKIASFGDTELIQKAKNTADAVFDKLEDFPLLKVKVEDMNIRAVSPD